MNVLRRRLVVAFAQVQLAGGRLDDFGSVPGGAYPGKGLIDQRDGLGFRGTGAGKFLPRFGDAPAVDPDVRRQMMLSMSAG